MLARFDRPRVDEPVTLAVVADPHVPADGERTWKVAHRARERFATALADADARGVDAVVLAGDLTGDGRRDSFGVVDEVLADLDSPRVAVPGNHDVPKAFDDHDGLPVEEFGARYTELPFVREVGPVTLVGVDTASAGGDLRHTWGGRVGERDRTWLADRLPGIDTPVFVGHHTLAPLPDAPGGKYRNFPLSDADAVRETLRAGGVELALTGHHHVPAVTRHGPLTALLAPAVCSYPQASALVRIGPDGTTVRLVPLADAAGVRESRRLARTGKPLGVGIATLVDRRLGSLPLSR